MNVWIGHYKGNTKEWFVVWAKSKHEAFLQIDPISGEPDMNSLMELNAPGFVDFTVNVKKEGNDDHIKFLPPKEDVEGGCWLVLGGGLGKVDDVEGHIMNRLKKSRS